MRLAKLLVAISAALTTGGCARTTGPSGGVPVGVSGTRWQFGPGESRVYFYGKGSSISAWDVGAKRTLWDRQFHVDNWVLVSSSGEKIVVVDQPSPGKEVRLNMVSAADGSTLFTTVVGPPWRNSSTEDERRFMAVSSDGAWAALSAGDATNAENLLLQSVSGEKVWFREGTSGVKALAFHPRRASLAVSWRSEKSWLDVYEQDGGAWKLANRREWAYCPQWTDTGLAFADKEGFHVVDGARSVAHVPFSFQDLASTYTPEQAAGYSCDRWRLSSDGKWLLRWKDFTLAVVNVATGATVISHQWDTRPTPHICSSGFSGDRARVITCNGYVFELDLAKKTVTQKEDLGPPATYDKNLYMDGATGRMNYRATLSPSGDWLVLQQKGKITLHRL